MNKSVSDIHNDHPARFERKLRAGLIKKRWLRLHISLICLFTFLACWGISSALLHAGVASLALRHAGALIGAYGVYLLLLWIWSHYLLGRIDPLDAADVADVVGDLASASSKSADTTDIRPGGGSFGGGGASSSWSGPASIRPVPVTGSGSTTGSAPGTGGWLDSADDNIAVAIPLAILVGIGTLLATGLGFAVLGLFGVEVLLGVAVEIAFASAGGAIALKARREGWMLHAIRRTAGPMAVVLAVSVGVSLMVSHWLPDAKTLPDAVRLIGQAVGG